MAGDPPILPQPSPESGDKPPSAPRPLAPEPASFRGATTFWEPGGLKPRMKPMVASPEGAPAGMSLTKPTPAPLPERGAGVFLLVNLVAAGVAFTFAVLLAFKL